MERNWRFSKAEIDIIAMDGNVLVFVEVKAKSYTFFGAPEESISAYKENLIIEQQKNKELQRELTRKEKALAETAALLVLRKKAQAIWGDSEEE